MSLRTILSFWKGFVMNQSKLPLGKNLLCEKAAPLQWRNLCQRKQQLVEERYWPIPSSQSLNSGRPVLTGSLNRFCPWFYSHKGTLSHPCFARAAFRFQSTNSSSFKEPSATGKVTKASKPARPRTKKPSSLVSKDEDQWLTTAFSMAEDFNLEHFNFDLQSQGNFQVASLPTDAHDVLHMKVMTSQDEEAEPSEIFIFRNGCLVFWNVAESTIKQVMKTATKHQSEPYEVALVNWENEQMNYSYSEGKSRLVKDSIVLNPDCSPEATTLEKFALSNAMVLSVKLAMWEYSLDTFVSSIEHIPETLKASGKLKMSHKTTMKHMGKLYSLRNRINLSSDLLNTPDFYWDRQELEDLFTTMCQFFNISRRTRVMNDKLILCNDLMDLMRNDVTEQHTLRLEAMITILIGVEIIIELSHYAV